MSKQIRVFIVDDHPIFVNGLIGMLSEVDSVGVLDTANNAEEAIEKLAKLKPDVVLMDIKMPNMDGIEATQKLVAEQPDLKILAMSMFEDADHIRRMLHAGAKGYLFKSVKKTELIHAIHQLHRGESYLHQEVIQTLLKSGNKKTGSDEILLTKREIEVLRYIVREFNNQEIADKLNISLLTVNSHRKNMLSKLNVRNTAGLVRYAIDMGLAD